MIAIVMLVLLAGRGVPHLLIGDVWAVLFLVLEEWHFDYFLEE